MNDYRIELGIGLNTQDFTKIKNDIKSLEDKPIRLEIDAETKELTKSIQDALKTLSKGGQNTLTLDTSKFEGSIADIKSAVVDLKKVLGTLDDSANMKSLLASVNQIANAIGKVTDESETLAKSLSILSKKDFGFNFNLKTGNANPIKAATDYGIEARRKAIPAMQEQVAFLQDIIGGTEKADKALERYLVKQNKGFGGVREKERLQREMLGGVDLDGKTVSISKQMGAYEQTISYLKKIAVESGHSLDGFDAHFSKAAENIVDDTVKIQTGVKQTEEALESAANEMKQIFSMGVGADQLSAQLEPIVSDLNQIREAVQNLSSGVSLEGLTASFDRLSGAIENLLANAEKVKGVLNGGFDVGNVGTDIGSIKTSSTTRRGTTSGADELDRQLAEWNIKGENAKTVRAKFKAFSDVSSLGAGNEAYDAALDDLTSTLRQLGEVYQDADYEAQQVLKALKGRKIKATKDVYGAEFGDDWANIKQTYKMLRNEGTAVDSAYAELSDPKNGVSSYFPDDIWNEADQLRQIIDAYDKAKRLSKGGYVDLDDVYGRRGLESEVLDIVSVMQEQVEAEQKVAQASAQSANIVAQSENKKRQEYEQTIQEIAQIDEAIKETERLISNPELLDPNISAEDQIQGYQYAIDNLEQRRVELVSKASSLGEELQVDKLDAFKNSLQSVGMDTDAIDNVTNRIQNLGVQIDTLDSKRTASGKKDILSVDISGVDEFGNAIKLTEQYNAATGDLIKTIDRVSTVQQKAGSSTDSFAKQQKTAVSNLTNQINQMNRAANDPNASRPIKDTAHLDSLKFKYNEIISAIERMENASSDTFVDEQNNVRKLISEYKSLVSEYKNAENVSTKMKGTDFGSGLDIAKNDLEKFKAEAKDFPQITATVKELDKAIEGVGDAASLNKFNDQLRVARSELAKVKSETAALNRSEKVGINTSGLESKIADLQRISPEIDKFETEIDGAKVSVKSLIDDLQQVKTQGDFSVVNARFKAFKEAASAAGIAVTEVAQKAKSINDIKIKISDTGFNGFEQEILRARNAAEELEGVYPDLEAALKRLDTAMEDVYSADQAGDVKRLVAANEEYEASLKQVYSQLKLYQQAEQKAYKAEMLNQRKSALSSEMETWLKENTRAARDFGEEIRRLQASLNGLDDKGVKLVGQQFKAITKHAQAMGKTGLTVFDRLKSKVKEYMAYLSAAEMFMWAEQTFREIFNTVKEIDTAMTGLYRVTDLTAAEYDNLFNNMISSAKEYGATLNDIINATTDWVRAGFDANTSLGLAEVTTMYQHISDLDYDTAAENLITAYNGFKDELNGAFSGDTVSAVNYIADILNELDNNYAATSAGIGEALTRSASALDLAGNSIQETAG